MSILYIDKHIVVYHKAAGFLCEGEGADCLPYIIKKELEDRGERSLDLFTLHRLDRETEGIVVYARSSSCAAKLSSQIADGKWEKIYRAWLWGDVSKTLDASGKLCDLLYYDRNRSKSFVVDRERRGVKKAELKYEILKHSEDKKRTLVLVELLTGRTHQIRVQFGSRGYAICGDRRYGAPAESGKIIALAAVSLSIFHPVTNEKMDFSIEPKNLDECENQFE